MVWKVKFTSLMLALLILLGANCARVSAATYDVYEGNPSNTQLQYFRDIISGIGLGDHYVAFRSGQYDYTMLVGNLVFENGIFSSTDSCIVYFLETNNSYNGYYTYSVSEVDTVSFNPEDKIIYSDLGQFPQLEERGAKYEILTAILIVAICVGYVCKSVFHYRPR